MSISSTGVYGSATFYNTIVNSDFFTDIETLKETVTTLLQNIELIYHKIDLI